MIIRSVFYITLLMTKALKIKNDVINKFINTIFFNALSKNKGGFHPGSRAQKEGLEVPQEPPLGLPGVRSTARRRPS